MPLQGEIAQIIHLYEFNSTIMVQMVHTCSKEIRNILILKRIKIFIEYINKKSIVSRVISQLYN